LNSRIIKALKVGDPQGQKPKANLFFFYGINETGGLEMMQIKVSGLM
jgi:hypothetical protein